jgi:NAD(P)-dependent dehydrogenase (short-subunit alcohol dehydrogenase family)
VDLRLEGKRALVTGSSRGIGADIAKELAGEGVRVAVHGRDSEAAAKVAQEIVEAGGEAKVVIGDLSKPEECGRVADDALAAFGGIDILVNNAGVSPPSNWDETKPELWLSTFETNVMPAVRLSMRFAPLMKEAGWGRLIHIGSSAGAMGLPRAPEYSASKAAFANISSSLAKHYGAFGITSNALGVGTIDNLGLRHRLASQSDAADPFYEMLTKSVTGHYNINPMGRTGRGEEVAFVVSMLASPRSSFVNGALIRVDGGKVPNVGL